MIDIHTHLLSGFDDGASNAETSLMMCATAIDGGTTSIIATPHFIEGTYSISSKDRIYEEVKNLNNALLKKKIDVIVYPGCEAYISLELPELVESGICATLNGTQYLLVELPMGNFPLYTDEVLYELQLLGITPVIAHPERYSKVMSDPECVHKLIEKGILIQINSGSIRGKLGRRAQDTAFALLDQGAVHFVASDGHSINSRKPRLDKAYDIVKKRYGQDNADLLFTINAQNLLKNQNIQGMLPIPHAKKFFRLKMLFSR